MVELKCWPLIRHVRWFFARYTFELNWARVCKYGGPRTELAKERYRKEWKRLSDILHGQA